MLKKLIRLIPARFRKHTTTINVLRLHGAIGMGGPMRQSLTAKDLEPLLQRAFKKGVNGVALSINCPGGSPVQSAMIGRRIRDLADEHKIPVYAFCEDVAASGGYWLACTADEIYADENSIVGSIGVISAGFGFTEAIAKLGIERRVHTSGENKSILDPFQPEKKEDVDRLLELQADAHGVFKTLVKDRRAGKLNLENPELFSGAFWSGQRALGLGLVDGLGHMHDVLRRKFGEKVELNPILAKEGWGLKRLGLGAAIDLPEATLTALESRALWQRFGL